MPTLKLKDAEIYYEETGSGYPVLLFAPGGMRSRIEMWHAPSEGPPRVWNDWTQVLSGAGYRVIAMDQRNAGRSRAPISATDGWETYAADHLALLDHLGARRAHVLGGCIGSSYCLRLIGVCTVWPPVTSRRNPTSAAAGAAITKVTWRVFAMWSRLLVAARLRY